MTDKDNSAKRLLEILKKAKDPSLSNAPPVVGWGKIFGIIEAQSNVVSEADEFEVARRLVQVHELINEIQSQLKSIEGLDTALFLRSFPRIRKVCLLSSLNQGALINIMNQLSDGDLTVLEFCANELSKHYSEPVVDEALLRDLRTQLDSLFDEIATSDLPPKLKQFLLKQLEIIRRAIQEYRIRGIDRLSEALERIVGSLLLNDEVIKNAHGNAQISKFKQVFDTFVALVSFASKVTPLVGPAAKVIRLLSSSDVDAIPPVEINSK